MKISKNYVVLAFVIAFLVSVVLCIYLLKRNAVLQEKSTQWHDNYLAYVDSTNIFRNDKGFMITVAKNYQFKISDLEKQNYSKDSLLGKYLAVIKSQDKKLKRVSEVTSVATETHGEGKVPIDTNTYEPFCRRANINDGFLDMKLFIWPDTVGYDYTERNEIFLLTELIRKPNKKGEQVSWLFRWSRPWVEGNTTASSINPNSTVTAVNQIKFVK